MKTSAGLVGGSALLLGAALAAAAPPERTVTWYQMGLPPAYLDAPDQDRDLQSKVDLGVKAALEAEGYSVVLRRVNLEQLDHELRESHFVCSGAQLREPAMESFLEYSIPHSVSLPPMAVIRADRAERFQPVLDAQGQLPLGAALAHSDLFLGVTAGRVYGGVIDQALQRAGERENLLRRNAVSNGPALLEMLLGGRIDYTILYPWEANYLADRVGQRAAVRKLPVQGMAKYVVVVVGCSKGPWGKAVIRIANRAITALRDTPEYQRLKESWLDEDERRLHRQYFEEVLRGAAAPQR